MLILRDYGTLALRDVLEPAIAYARNGHPLVERATATIATVAELFREHWPTSAAVYLPGGKVPATGTLFTNRRTPRPTRASCEEAEAGGGGREAEIERGAGALEPGLRRRGDRLLLPHAGGDGRARPAPPRRAHGRRHGALVATRRGAAHLRLRPLHACCKTGPGPRAR